MTTDFETCTITEAAKLLGVSRSRVRQLMVEGKLEHDRIGRHYVVTRASVYARIAASSTPPGVSSLLHYLRFLRDLTGDQSSAASFTWQSSLRDYARQLFGHETGQPFKERLHALACTMLTTAKEKGWKRLDEQREELYLLWLEYDFTAAPLKPQARKLPASVQTSLFGDAPDQAPA